MRHDPLTSALLKEEQRECGQVDERKKCDYCKCKVEETTFFKDSGMDVCNFCLADYLENDKP